MNSLTDRFRTEVFGAYVDLVRSEFQFHPRFAAAEREWAEQLTPEHLVNGPFLERAHLYARGDDLADIPLTPEVRAMARKRLKDWPLYAHQAEALRLVLAGKNAVITTGTSSGKTLCYQLPILNDLILDPSVGLRAIIVYPMNALANDQLTEWEVLLEGHPEITFARFTGQTPADQEVYETRLQEAFRSDLIDSGRTGNELTREVDKRVREHLADDAKRIPNRLNHRDAIRQRPPHVLITNFSMLEYLLERPVDAPIFDHSRLRFLVLDEVHSYRGIQSTEIAFLVRRLKDRLGIEHATCIATSATLGKDTPEGAAKVRQFASRLFGEDFEEPNPIRGKAREVVRQTPVIAPIPSSYGVALSAFERGDEKAAAQALGGSGSLLDALGHDSNLYELRSTILASPIHLSEAAAKLWPDADAHDREEALVALLGLSARMTGDDGDALLPARLHYFVRTLEGLFACLRTDCPGRKSADEPAYFVSRSHTRTPQGACPACHAVGWASKLVEVLGCRRCGYLFGALQDMGPRSAPANDDVDDVPFDVFETELGDDDDAFRSYFHISPELPRPSASEDDEDEEPEGTTLSWCASCGCKVGEDRMDCVCADPHPREIEIFHRQCVPGKTGEETAQNLMSGRKLLRLCPNCGAQRVSVEPMQRFREWRDEQGSDMAVPLAYFQVRPVPGKRTGKLLCFTDNRQRAAAFPTLLEDRTFPNDLGRAIVSLLKKERRPLHLEELADEIRRLAHGERADGAATGLFLPASRLPDGPSDQAAERNAWRAEIFAYFSIRDAARQSLEDLGLVSVLYRSTSDFTARAFERAARILAPFGLDASEAAQAVQMLLRFMRHDKAISLPNGVEVDAPAFGAASWRQSYVREGAGPAVRSWIGAGKRVPRPVDYISRVTRTEFAVARGLTGELFDAFTDGMCAAAPWNAQAWQVDHEGLEVELAATRFVCSRCGEVTTFAPRRVCPRVACDGRLEPESFDPARASRVDRWIAGLDTAFATLRSEEHTAQIEKPVAEQIERRFRASEIDLLSSTTTFELGINIGDLQTVLLRNVPLSSANYIQRVGRTGRGIDKNAVCVTLCDRGPYESDTWRDPKRIMSGEVRPPAVFLANPLIAQRHFNARLFAAFLRQRVVAEGALPKPGEQKIALANVLPTVTPAFPFRDWLPKNLASRPLDFAEWLKKTAPGLPLGAALSDLVATLGGATAGIEHCGEDYEATIADIEGEITTLMDRRSELFAKGKQSGSIDTTVRNILNDDVISLLAKEGFLPRYAFPLDVVSLETGRSRWAPSDVTLQRDRGQAISEYAPGMSVIAHKTVFESAGLYIGSERDKPRIRYLFRCPDCRRVQISDEKTSGACVCGLPFAPGNLQRYIEPAAFSVQTGNKDRTGIRHRRGPMQRQTQSLVSFIDVIEADALSTDGQFVLALKADGHLFRYNSGPRGKGFAFCTACGAGFPEALARQWSKRMKEHPPLRSFDNASRCRSDGNAWLRTVRLGHRFQSQCLSIRPKSGDLDEPTTVSVSAALHRAACEILDLDRFDIGVTVQASPTEVVLYDNTPGGAGFVADARDAWPDVVAAAVARLESCTCEKACYDCLKHYGNQRQHDRLDRHAALAVLRRN